MSNSDFSISSRSSGEPFVSRPSSSRSPSSKKISKALEALKTPFSGISSFFARTELSRKQAKLARRVDLFVFNLERRIQRASRPTFSKRALLIKWEHLKWKVSRYDFKSPLKNMGEQIAGIKRRIFDDPDSSGTKPSGSTSLPDHSPIGSMVFTGNFLSGFGIVLGLVGSMSSIIIGSRMIVKGIQMAKRYQGRPDLPLQRANYDYGKELMRDGASELLVGMASMGGVLVSTMQAAAKFAAFVAPATQAGVITVLQVGTAVAAPITICLSSYGAFVNIKKIYRTTTQLRVLREERARLENIKQNKGIRRFSDEVDENGVNLKEREEIVLFAIRKLGDLRINNIVGLLSNSCYIVGAGLSFGTLASGPAAAAFGSLSLVCFVSGAGGALLTRAILVGWRHRRKSQQKRKMGYALSGPRYISSKEMRRNATKILSSDRAQRVHYDLSKRRPVADLNNGELLTLLFGTKRTKLGIGQRMTADERRNVFLVNPNRGWKKTFG